ncbi:GDSL-type esterase/lipase family protein [Corynebacterium felinum]|uniref:Lysophospholipase L1-like esterase n=1 Tax=Corynebacterium felinum TaxID=131318 RepID=A0ABU2B7B7_9CORY|nr:GDSL-type esterase/lipase family protein [Corynebacterium felinum]MDF5820563.1 GDSL-type esterase/lipase family protein [Corynebacterium felinum]MDR7353668.1 lysophospholipase L1-like esterase [Corynebacterium felinum]WJY95847.1 Lipase 2 precursor [Corynebacterium felinum]
MFATLTRRLIATTLAATACLSLNTSIFAPEAHAQQKQVVMFGDSLLANPYFLWADRFQGPGKVTPNAPGQWRCPRGENRVASALARHTGAKVEDFACTGAVAYAPIEQNKRLSKQVTTALEQNQLTPSTTNVLIQIGFNDTWKAPGFYNVQTKNFVDEMRTQVARIRQAAPNARIAFLGYPAMVGPNGEVCAIHWNNSPALPIQFGFVRSAFNSVHDWQRQAANATGAEWIDLEKESSGHDMCAPQDQRWVAGIFDNSSAPYNITTHLTHHGNDQIAGIIARKI